MDGGFPLLLGRPFIIVNLKIRKKRKSCLFHVFEPHLKTLNIKLFIKFQRAPHTFCLKGQGPNTQKGVT